MQKTEECASNRGEKVRGLHQSTNKRTSTQWWGGSVCDCREERKAAVPLRKGLLVEFQSLAEMDAIEMNHN